MDERQVYETLAAYEEAARGPGGVDLPAFVEARPELSAELIDYAAYQFVFEHGAVYNPRAATPEFEQRLLARAAEIRDRKQGLAAARSATLTSLVEAAKQRGLTVPILARRLRLSPLEVTKLNQRLIRAESIPAALVRRLADTLEQSVESVAVYLRMPPTLSAQTSYKSDSAPQVASQSDFADAIESSRALSPEDKSYWKELARDDEVTR